MLYTMQGIGPDNIEDMTKLATKFENTQSLEFRVTSYCTESTSVE